MSKIMKKVLSLLVVIALVCVPTVSTVMAAVGDAVAVPDWDHFIWSGDTVTVAAGETVFYEIQPGDPGEYEFVVSGEGDFAVAVCNEDGAGAYLEGTPVSAVDGVVNTTLVVFESTYGCGCFSITNNSDSEASYTAEVVFPVGSQNNPDAITLTLDTPVSVTLAAGAQYYFSAALPAMNTEYVLAVTGATGFALGTGMGMPTYDTDGAISTTIAHYFGAGASFFILNNTESEQTYSLALDNMPLGSQSNPDELAFLNNGECVLEGSEYWYSWTAETDGTVTLTIDTEKTEYWTYNLIVAGYNTYNFSTAWDEYENYTITVDVAAGEEVLLGLSIPVYDEEYEYWNAYACDSGTVYYSITATETVIEKVEEPEVDTAYKFYIEQENVGSTLYLNGEMNGFYFATTTDLAEAVDVYLENYTETITDEETGIDSTISGYRLYFYDAEEVKTYIEVVINGNYKNVVFVTEPTNYFVYDGDLDTLIITLSDGNQYYLGTYNYYQTFSASTIDKAATSFVAHLGVPVLQDIPAEDADDGNEDEGGETDEPVIEYVAELVENPTVGTAYKFYIEQKTLGTTLYLTGEMNGFYFATTADTAEAIDVYLEEVDSVEGGYRLYFYDAEEVKTYIEVVINGNYKNVVFVTEPTNYFVYDEELDTLLITLSDENQYYLGTYGTYSTFSASTIDKAATSFVAHLGVLVEKSEDEGGEDDDPVVEVPEIELVTVPEIGVAYKYYVDQLNLSSTLYLTGAMSGYYYATTTDIAAAQNFYFEEVDGGYNVYTYIDSVKTYIDVVVNGNYINVIYTTEPTAVFVWNETYNTIVTTLNDTEYYLGSYNSFNTVSASKISYAATSFVGHFGAVPAIESEGLVEQGGAVAVPNWDCFIMAGATVDVPAGTTVYYEMQPGMELGDYSLVVTGEGSFAVGICGEDGEGAYLAGSLVHSVSGVYDGILVTYESTYGCGCFSITNISDADATYTVEIIYPVGHQNNPEEIVLDLDATVTVTVPAGSEYYFNATLPEGNKEYMFTITGETGFALASWGMPIYDTEGTLSSTLTDYGTGATFGLINNTESDQEYVLAIGNMPYGSQSNPATLVTGAYVQLDLTGNQYWYNWTAEEDGVLTITIDTEATEYWTYYIVDANWTTYNYSTAWEEYDYYTIDINVSAGDVIELAFSIPTYDEEYDYWNAYGYGTGSFVFSNEFVAGEGGGDDDDDDDEGDPDGYINSDSYLQVGEFEYTVDALYGYTVYTFEPTETGVYTISVSDGLLGIVSYNGMWVTIEPSAETITESSIEWECTGVGQTIWVAVQTEGETALINITRTDAEPEMEWTYYENTVIPETFVLGAFIEENYVDTFDAVLDNAVLGSDGYYHLNSEDGPILYVNLSDSLMSLAGAYGYGQLVFVSYDDEGNIVEKIDYNEAFAEYFACSDDGIYPLTEDLLIMFKYVGEYQGWYGTEGWVGGELEDAWMFACYYYEFLGDVNGDGSIVAVDYLMLKRAVLGTYQLDESAEARGDIDGNGSVDSTDYFMLKRHVLGTYVIGG